MLKPAWVLLSSSEYKSSIYGVHDPSCSFVFWNTTISFGTPPVGDIGLLLSCRRPVTLCRLVISIGPLADFDKNPVPVEMCCPLNRICSSKDWAVGLEITFIIFLSNSRMEHSGIVNIPSFSTHTQTTSLSAATNPVKNNVIVDGFCFLR